MNRLTIAKGVKSVRAALDALKASGIGHVVMDAVADADLAAIATATLDLPLLTGGSALAMPLPALLHEKVCCKRKAVRQHHRISAQARSCFRAAVPP